jgi:4-amino-4-deoxy-L-arabinose transferase-like glycosyltransferase
MAVFSYMKGIFHPYYTIALAPLIAAVVGLGGGLLWQRREQLLPRVGLAIAVAGTGWWSFVLLERTSAWHPWIRYTVAVTAGLAALALVFAPMVGRLTNRASATARWGTIALGVVAALLGPGAYAVATAGTGHTGSIPSAGPQSGGFGGPGGFGGGGPRMVIQNGAAGQPGFPGGRGGFPGGVAPNGSAGQNGGLGSQAAPNANGQPGGQAVPGGQGNVLGGTGGGQLGDRGGINNLLDASTPSATIQAMLKKDASSYRWTAAAIGAQNAAGYQLATGDPVMAIGGFNGSDPSPTLAQFQAYVAAHKIHYYIGGGIGMQSNGGADEGGDIGTWVKAHYTAQTVDGVTLYDLSAAPIG